MNIAVMCSGSGSNLQALLDAEASDPADDEIVFDSGLAGLTVNLTANLDNGPSTAFGISGSGGLTITGLTSASGARSRSVFSHSRWPSCSRSSSMVRPDSFGPVSWPIRV